MASTMVDVYNDQYALNLITKNNVTPGWKEIMLKPNVLNALKILVKEPCFCIDEFGNWNLSPIPGRVLAAFSYHEPEDTKAVVIATSPMSNDGKANGLALSGSNLKEGSMVGKTVRVFNQAINGGPVVVDSYSLEWLAAKGVLLLNSALTIPSGNENYANIKKHCNLWKDFLVELLSTWLCYTQLNNPLIVIPLGYPNGDGINFAGDLMQAVRMRLVKMGLQQELYMMELQKGCYQPSRVNPTAVLAQHAIQIYVFPSIHHPTYPRGSNNQFRQQIIPVLDFANQIHPGLFTYVQRPQLQTNQ